MTTRKKLLSVWLAFCMMLAMLPGTALAANRPGNSTYWENLSVSKANAMADAIYNRSSTEDMVLIYTFESGINSSFARIAEENEVKAGCFYHEDGQFSGIWQLTGYGTISFPVIVTYNGTTRNYKVTIGNKDSASFEEQLRETGLLGGSGSADGLQPFYSSNAGGQNYNGNYATTVKSYLYENEIGGVTRVEYYGNVVIVEDYDSSYTLKSRKEIESELPIWGGFFAGEDNFFLIFGQSNPSESDNVEVIRVVKYSKDWQRLDSYSLKGANTYIPFDAGSVRCTESGGKLYVRTCHEMYESDDGLHHQANMMLVLQQSDMSLVESYYRVEFSPYGYVSHSFNQFILADQSGNIVCVDHGDAYPREIVLNCAGRTSTIQNLPGATGNNVTGASVGGFAETSSGYVTAYNYDGTGGRNPRNVYFAYTTKGDLATSNPVQVTSGGGYSTPVLAPTGLNGGYLLWNDSGSTLYYASYSADGSVGTARTASALLSDCQPILHNGKLVWYTTNSSAPVFYTLDESGVTAVSTVREPCAVHKWDNGSVTTEPTCAKEGVRIYTCTACGYTKTESIPKLPNHTPGDTVTSNNNGTHGGKCTVCGEVLNNEPCTYSEEITKEATCKEEGSKTLTCKVCGYTKTESIPKLTTHTPGDTITSNNNGTHGGTCSVCGTVLDSEPCTYSEEITKEATCKEEGSKMLTCKVCGYTKTESIPKLTTHTPGDTITSNNNGTHGGKCSVCGAVLDNEPCTYSEEVTKEATCKEEGSKTLTCTVCGYTKTETIPKLTTHTSGGDVKYNGDGTHSGTCSVCGTVLDSEPCDYSGTGEVTVEATCVKDGERIVSCAVCASKKTQIIPALGHNYRDYQCTRCGETIPNGLKASYDEVVSLDERTFTFTTDNTLNDAGVEQFIVTMLRNMLNMSRTSISVDVLSRDYMHDDMVRCTYTVSVENVDGDSFTTQHLTMDLELEEPVSNDEEYYISVPSTDNGEVISSTRHAAEGSRVSLSVYPDSGYELDSLTVTNARGREIVLRGSGSSYSFTMPSSRVTVEAVFTKTEEPSTPSSDSSDDPSEQIFTGLGTPGISGIVLNPSPMPFVDVNSTNWFYNDVNYVWKHYLMSGVSDTVFSPNTATTRGMIWTILARMNNVRTEVNPGSTWYERGQLWAMEQGVTDGTNPLGEVTREQLAAMLWRSAGSPIVAADLSRFGDSAAVSSYAKGAMSWAVATGILNGSDGNLNPKGTATRAQVAAMTARYGDKIG